MSIRGSRALLLWTLAAAVAMAGTAVVIGVTRDEPQERPPPSPGPPLGTTALKYRLDQRFAPIFFCDPDFFPVGSDQQEHQNAARWWASVDRSGDEVVTILGHLDAPQDPDDEQILLVYREHKRLMTIGIEPQDDGFRFTLRSGQEADAEQIGGTITRDGIIRIEQRDPANTACPICLAAATLIATPQGDVPVAEIREGMLVWSVDAEGRRIAARVQQTVRRSLGVPVLLVRVDLSDGRSLTAAAAHPTADGRVIGALTPGASLDGAAVVGVKVVSVADGLTFDLLLSGPSSAYRANGVLLGSTLQR